MLRDKYTKWYFTYDDYIILQDETWMILTVFEKLEKFCYHGIFGICLLEKLEEVSLQLWCCACLAKLCHFLVF